MRPVLAWGLGWGVAAILVAVTIVLAVADWPEAATTLTVGLASATAFGFPAYLSGRRDGSRRPRAQALIWTAAFGAAGVIIAQHYVAQSALALPGDLNINTTETIRARQASFERWGVAPEVVSSYVLVFGSLVAASFASGWLSVLVAAGWRIDAIARGALVGVVAAVAIVPAVALIPIGVYLIAGVLALGGSSWLPAPLRPLMVSAAVPLAAMLAGCGAGAMIEYARAVLLPRRPAA